MRDLCWFILGMFAVGRLYEDWIIPRLYEFKQHPPHQADGKET